MPCVYRLSIPQKDVHMRFQMFEILDDKMIVQYKRDSVFDEVMEDEETIQAIVIETHEDSAHLIGRTVLLRKKPWTAYRFFHAGQFFYAIEPKQVICVLVEEK